MVFSTSWLTVLALVALVSPSVLAPVAAHSHTGSHHGHGLKLATRLKAKAPTKRVLVRDRVVDGAPAPSTNAQRFQRGMGPLPPKILHAGEHLDQLRAEQLARADAVSIAGGRRGAHPSSVPSGRPCPGLLKYVQDRMYNFDDL